MEYAIVLRKFTTFVQKFNTLVLWLRLRFKIQK